jgi:hypothetical protein
MLYGLWSWQGRKYVHPVGVLHWHGVHMSGFGAQEKQTDGTKVYFPLLACLFNYC